MPDDSNSSWWGGEVEGNGRCLIRGSVPVILLDTQKKTKAVLRQNDRSVDRDSTLVPPEISSKVLQFDPACLENTRFSVLRQNDRPFDRDSTLVPPEISSKVLQFDPACLANTRFSYEVFMCTSNMSGSLDMCLYLMQKWSSNLAGWWCTVTCRTHYCLPLGHTLRVPRQK